MDKQNEERYFVKVKRVSRSHGLDAVFLEKNGKEEWLTILDKEQLAYWKSKLGRKILVREKGDETIYGSSKDKMVFNPTLRDSYELKRKRK